MRVLGLALAVYGVAFAADPPAIHLARVASGFTAPLDVRFDSTGRMFVVEQRGIIRLVKNGTVLQQPFLDMRSLTTSGAERGLLGMALSPDFDTSSTFYLYYTDRGGDLVIARLRASLSNPDVADADSRQILLQIEHSDQSNHNGGNLVFGPDGYLYIGTGDGGGGGDPQNNGQNTSSLLGKMLRIDVRGNEPRYAVPASNPFIDRTGYRPEIWAFGLRNPWRYSFDRETGDLWIGDVGQNRAEEVNFQPASSRGGENYGWRRMEGMQCFPSSSTCDRTGLTLPVVEYTRTLGVSVTGGFVYRGSRYPALRGFYLYADFGTGNIWALQRSGTGWDNRLILPSGLSLSTFGQDASGELYLASYATGEVMAITSDSPNAPPVSVASVVNAASFAPGVSPGSLATLFGTGITSQAGIRSVSTFPLPATFEGISVRLNNVLAPILAVANVNGQEQINFQIPFELAGLATASLVVTSNGVASAPVDVRILDVQPESFVVTRGAVNTAVIWATGLGPVTNAPGTGRPAPSGPFAEATRDVSVTVGGTGARVLFAGLAPSFAGLYQINIELPNGATAGSPIVITSGAATSKAVALP